MPSTALLPPSRCEASFWDFAVPTALGGVASSAASFLVRRALPDVSSRRQEAIGIMAGTLAFWVVGGITWVVRTRWRSRLRYE